MRYWPLSALIESPLMGPMHALELQCFYRRPPSEPAFYACLDVASRTRPADMPGLMVIESVNAPNRLVYSQYPDWAEWSRLERAGVFEADGCLVLFMEALH